MVVKKAFSSGKDPEEVVEKAADKTSSSWAPTIRTLAGPLEVELEASVPLPPDPILGLQPGSQGYPRGVPCESDPARRNFPLGNEDQVRMALRVFRAGGHRCSSS